MRSDRISCFLILFSGSGALVQVELSASRCSVIKHLATGGGVAVAAGSAAKRTLMVAFYESTQPNVMQ